MDLERQYNEQRHSQAASEFKRNRSASVPINQIPEIQLTKPATILSVVSPRTKGSSPRNYNITLDISKVPVEVALPSPRRANTKKNY